MDMWKTRSVGPFGSQKQAVQTVKKYDVREGFAVSIVRTILSTLSFVARKEESGILGMADALARLLN